MATRIYGGPEAQEAFHAYTLAREPKFARFLVDTWNAENAALKFADIEAALISGDLTGAQFEAWRDTYSQLLADKIGPMWSNAMAASGKPLAHAIEAIVEGDFAYNPAWPWIQDYLDVHGAEWVVQVSDSQKAGIRALLNRFAVEEPINPKVAARFIRPTIGLTEKQALAVANFRDLQIKNGFTGKRLEETVAKKASFLLRRRAENIARTELARAWGQGQRQTIRQAKSDGLFPGKRMIKEWFTAVDEQVCSVCGPMEGATVPIDEPFITIDGPVDIPSEVHNQCRCDEGYSTEAI